MDIGHSSYLLMNKSGKFDDGDTIYELVGNNEEYAVFLKPGRSVYVSSIEGSQYESAKLYFCRIDGSTPVGVDVTPLLITNYRRKG